MRDTEAASAGVNGHNVSQSSNDTRDVLARVDMATVRREEPIRRLELDNDH